MFDKYKIQIKDLEIEKNRIDREVELYRREKMQTVNIDIENHKIKRLKEVANLEIECHKQLAEYEHEFHSTKERLGIDLAKLEAKIEYLKENNDAYQSILASKENEINRLVSVINSLTKIKTK
jgi:chromosome segregation ATPase